VLDGAGARGRLGRVAGSHSGLRCVWGSAACAAVAAAAACATSVQDREHGPAFGDGGDDATQGPESGGRDVGADVAMDATQQEAAADAPAETSADGAPEADAPSCASTMALVGASGSTFVGANFVAGQWSAASAISGGAAAAAPSIVAVGGGAYVATSSHTGDGKLDSTAFTGSWSAATQIGTALAQGTPSLATVGGSAHVVYWGANGKFYHGVYTAKAWDAASDPVGGDESQSFGSSAPSAAGVGAAKLLVAQSGSNGVLYDQSWSGGTWGSASAHPDATVVTTISPAIVAMTAGAGDAGSADAMIVTVYVDDAGSYFLQYTVHSANGWSAAADVYDMNGMVAYTGFAPSLAALPGGRAVLAWVGSNPSYPYYAAYDPQSGWSAPAAIASVAVASPPSVAAGVCGADAVAAIVPSGTGDVRVVTLSGSTWSSPAAITGSSGATWAAIASTP
jgi:hypothetical protein